MHPAVPSAFRIALALLIALSLLAPEASDAKKKKRKRRSSFVEASWTSGPFVAQPGHGGETGWLEASMRASGSRVEAEFDGLAPGAVVQVVVDGRPGAQLVADAAGRARATFESPLTSGHAHPLDFDPRTARIGLRSGGLDGLGFQASGAGRTAGVVARERLHLRALPGARPGAGGRLAYDVTAGGDAYLTLAVWGLPLGPAELWVDGSPVAAFEVVKKRSKKKKKKKRKKKRGHLRTKGVLRLDTVSGSLGFDPIGRVVEVVSAGQSMLSSEVRAQAHGVTPCQETIEQVFLARVAGSGTAKARFRTRKDCDRDFEVELEDVPAGSYELRTGGVTRGFITAVFVPAKGQVEGEIEFDSDADDPGELPLDFDPHQGPIEVLQTGALWFQGSLGSPSSGGLPSPGICQEVEVRRDLVSTGLAPRAKGDARRRVRDDCRRDFRVEVEDLPAGSYQLFVDGIARGTFVVSSALFESELEFDTDLDEVGELPLTFEPAGALLEVRQGSSTFLTLRMP